MEKLITALDNKNINLKLKNLNKYEINYADISYQEGVLEILEKENIDIILLSEILEGPYEIKEFIKIIKTINKNINIILILEKKNKLLEDFLVENNINNYFYNKELAIENFNNKILNKNKDINLIKNIILKQNCKKNIKYKIFKINKKYFKIKKRNIALSICGKDSIEKSIFCLMLSSVLEKQRKKVLIIDFDILNENLNSLFGVEKFPNKFNNQIIKINNYVNIYSGLNFIIKNNNEKIIEEINILKNNYDYILFNLSSEFNIKLSKKLINISKYCLFIFNENLTDFKYNNNLLNIYMKEWNINKEKFICILNIIKNVKFSKELIKNIFNNYKVILKEKKNDFFILDYSLKKCTNNYFIKKDYYNILKIINK